MGLHGRHTRLAVWRPLSVSGSWNCANSDNRRRDFRTDISAISRTIGLDYRRPARRSLRASDRFDAPLPRALAFVQIGASPAVNNRCWSYTLAFAPPETGYFTSGACDRSVGRSCNNAKIRVRPRSHRAHDNTPVDRYATLIFTSHTKRTRNATD